jgi:hypothetical protein
VKASGFIINIRAHSTLKKRTLPISSRLSHIFTSKV